MSETRDFPTAVIASLSTGVLLCKFGEMHEAAEYLMGHPIWTHHFGSKELWRKMQFAVIEQCPGMPTALPDADKDNYLAKLADIEAEIGKVVKIRKGNGASAIHPLEGIPEGKPVIVVQTGEHKG
jgi:hypothetical protein